MSDATGATTTVMFVEFSQLSLLAGREGGGRERESFLCVCPSPVLPGGGTARILT